MKIVISVLLALLLIFVVLWVYTTQGMRVSLIKEMNEVQARLYSLKDEQQHLQSEIEYYSHPENLVKLLLERLNLKRPGERSIIFSP